MKLDNKLTIIIFISTLCYIAAGLIAVGTVIFFIFNGASVLVGLVYAAAVAFNGLLLSLIVDAFDRLENILLDQSRLRDRLDAIIARQRDAERNAE